MRLDLRQRVIVKALVSRHPLGRSAGAGLARHVAYLARDGAGAGGERGAFFDADRQDVDPSPIPREWASDRHHFRLIISPEHGERIADLPGYVRTVMGRVADDLAEPQLTWIGVCHFDTDQPHAHVLVRGRRADRRDLVMPRAYISHGLRTRAQEVAQELLGDLSRPDAEKRVWRETQANHFTQLDRRLIAAVGADGLVPDGIGRSDAWSALTRGRLRHLELVGLAQREGRAYRLAPNLETSLRRAQLRMDVIRVLNQRRLSGAREVRVEIERPVAGKVVQSGYHDELGAAGFVVLADAHGVEHYRSLGAGISPPRAGALIKVEPLAHGRNAVILTQRARDQSL